MFKDTIGLAVLGDAIDFALIMQFGIFAILSMACQKGEAIFTLRQLVPMLSLCANAFLGIWHFCSTSPWPMSILAFLVVLPLLVPVADGGGQ